MPYAISPTQDAWRHVNSAADLGPNETYSESEPVLLPIVKADCAATTSAACQALIYAGFQSSALGKPYLYPAKDTDQQNLIASVVDALMNTGTPGYSTAFWCADSAGVWAYRPHTAAQIQQVGKDGKAAILAALTRNAVAQAAIAAATSVAAVQAVVL